MLLTMATRPQHLLPLLPLLATQACTPQGIDGVPKISQDYNPATWMLEVTNVAVENRTGQDFAALYASSDMYKCALPLTPTKALFSRCHLNLNLSSDMHGYLNIPVVHREEPALQTWLICIDCLARQARQKSNDHREKRSAFVLTCRRAETMITELAAPAPDSQPLHFPTEYAVGRLGQLKTIVWKLSCVYWRYTGWPLILVPTPPRVCMFVLTTVRRMYDDDCYHQANVHVGFTAYPVEILHRQHAPHVAVQQEFHSDH